jgi:tRNA pseudouridine55 synthase
MTDAATIDAALLLDKPVGISSNRALQEVKKIFKVRKAGHAGTLDPLASGLLLVLFGEATKFAGPLLDADKEYVTTVKLGEKTTTGDAEGEVVERSAFQVFQSAIPETLKKFEGSIEQVPPMYSALKRDGVPLYELARRGESVERPARRVEISLLEEIRFEAPLLELRVRCSKGTYIRTLAEDIAVALGTVGHVTALRRTASGAFKVSDAVGLEALEGMGEMQRRGRLLPLTALLGGLPRAELDAAEESRFRNGQTLAFDGAQGLCGVYGRGGVVGLGKAEAGRLHPVRLTATQGAE